MVWFVKISVGYHANFAMVAESETFNITSLFGRYLCVRRHRPSNRIGCPCCPCPPLSALPAEATEHSDWKQDKSTSHRRAGPPVARRKLKFKILKTKEFSKAIQRSCFTRASFTNTKRYQAELRQPQWLNMCFVCQLLKLNIYISIYIYTYNVYNHIYIYIYICIHIICFHMFPYVSICFHMFPYSFI